MGLFLSLLLGCYTIYDHSLLQVSNSDNMEVAVIGPPTQKAEWKEPPSVKICAATKVSVLRMQTAIKYWEMLGYEFDHLSVDRSLTCMQPRHGEIIVTLPEGHIKKSRIAATRLYTETMTVHIAKDNIYN